METTTEKVETSSEGNATGEATQAGEETAARARRGLGWTGLAIGVGAAVLQPELIPGLALGAALALAPRYAPRFRDSWRKAGSWFRRTGARAAEEVRDTAEEVRDAAQNEPREPTHH